MGNQAKNIDLQISGYEQKGIFLAAVMCFIGFSLGLETGGLQFVLLKAANEFHLSQAAMGSIVTVQFIAVTIAPLIIGSISDRIGKKIVIIGASLLCACGSIINIASENMTTLLVGIVLVGFAFGSLETTITAALSDTFHENSGRYISVMQSCLSLGAVIAPLLVNSAINQGNFNWRVLFWICLLFSVIGGVATCFTTFRTFIGQNISSQKEKVNIRNTVMIGALLLIAIYMTVENNTTCFIDAFYTTVLQDDQYSAMALSGFWAAMTISRLLFSRLYEKRNAVIPILCAVAAIALIFMNWMDIPLLVMGNIFVIGFCYGPMSPFVMNIAVERYPQKSGTIAGIMLGFMGAGGALGPVLGGYIADFYGLRSTYIFTGILAFAEMVIFFKLIAGRKIQSGHINRD